MNQLGGSYPARQRLRINHNERLLPMQRKLKRKRDAGRSLQTLVEAEVPMAFKLPEVAVLLSVSLPTVRRLITRGLLRPVRSLRHILISDTELRRFLREGVSE